LGIGLDTLTGDTHAFVNLTREQLLARAFDTLSPERCTIGLLETSTCDARTIAICKDLRSAGFSLALSDLVSGRECRPILQLAQVVKVDVIQRTDSELAATVRRLAPFSVRLLAEKVENAATYAKCRQLGFGLFQGFHFARPRPTQRRNLPTHIAAVARLMNLVLDDAVTDRAIEDAFRMDPRLSLGLLRIANSAAYGSPGISTIEQAVRMVGRGPLHRWLALLFANTVPRDSGVDTELVLESLERARLCEIIAERSGHRGWAQSLFLVGLLSNFDAILGIAMDDLLRTVNVAREVKAALLGEDGPFTPHLSIAAACVEGDLERVMELNEQTGIVGDLTAWHIEASGWARGMMIAA
jgi:EAL and modified HD-GYP domain-containing signal transduction protein